MLISSHYDHNLDHVRFIRVRADRGWVELEKSKPIKAWGYHLGEIVAGLLTFAGIAMAMFTNWLPI